jgi:hypothetical protein
MGPYGEKTCHGMARTLFRHGHKQQNLFKKKKKKKKKKNLSKALKPLPDWEGLDYIQTASLHN